MEEDQKQLYKRVVRISALGLEMGFCVAIGIVMGYYLDGYWGTKPWLTLIFMILGVGAGFRTLFTLIKRLDQNSGRK